MLVPTTGSLEQAKFWLAGRTCGTWNLYSQTARANTGRYEITNSNKNNNPQWKDKDQKLFVTRVGRELQAMVSLVIISKRTKYIFLHVNPT